MVDSRMTWSHNFEACGYQLSTLNTINSPLLLRARVVLPVSQPPIREGAVLVSGNRVVAIGRWRDLVAHRRPRTVDLGEAVLMPGLVNAHCHLDYTDMAGQFAPPNVFASA